jgi:hypothetical protein
MEERRREELPSTILRALIEAAEVAEAVKAKDSTDSLLMLVYSYEIGT